MENFMCYGGINFDELLAAAKSGNVDVTVVTKADGSTFRSIPIIVWHNAVRDDKGQDGSIQVQFKKEAREAGLKNPYIANLRKSEPKVKPAPANAFDDVKDDVFDASGAEHDDDQEY